MMHEPPPPAGSSTGDYTPPPADVRAGPYKLLQAIGEGGMGVVYLAEQEAPVRRRVAVKVLKAGLDSKQVLARFEAERQALALMDHPNIAKVFDAGTTSDGRPYFVMELVKGVPLTRFCDDSRLSPRQRLELFVDVCHALQHAHQKGIIHRDVKPTNVLVALYDGRPAPKVIDFGVAKATAQTLTERTLFTGFGQIVGTLEYMAPEQAEMNALDVDTRSDIYSLGVLLYELLTGTTPLERERLRQAALPEVLRLIREEEPPRPSLRLSRVQPTAGTVSSQRMAEPVRLAKLVRGELDWIALKALEKDRARRYPTADALANDVERYLRDEPVEACPPSRWYRARKFIRKNRRWLATAATIAVLLITGTSISVWQAVRAEQAEAQARNDRDVAEGVCAFLNEDLLLAAAKANEPDLRQALKRATAKLGQRFAGKPLAEARVRWTLGSAYSWLRDLDEAEVQLLRARELYLAELGPDHLDTLATGHWLAHVYMERGKYDVAEQLLEDCLARNRRLFGDNHLRTLACRRDLGDLLRARGRLAEADAHLSAAMAGLEHPALTGLAPEEASRADWELALARQQLSLLRDRQGRWAEAETLGRQAYQRLHTEYAPDHPHIARMVGELGNRLLRQHKFAEAEAELRACLAIREKKTPNDWQRYLAQCQLGAALLGQKKYEAAEAHLLAGFEGLKAREAALDEDGRQGLRETGEWIVRLYEEWGRPDKAAAWRTRLAGIKAA